MPLSDAAEKPTDDDATRLGIVLGILNVQQASGTDWKSYFCVYERECARMIQDGVVPGMFTTIRTHADIIKVTQKLRDGVPKDQILQSLIISIRAARTPQEKEKMADGSLLLAARLMSMMNIGPLPYGVHKRQPIPWPDNVSTLKRLTEKEFTKLHPQKKLKLRFRGDFIAFNIRRFTQLKVKWTDNLADHLQILDKDKHLCIFHHDTFLQHQRSDIFPVGLLDETRRTLDLLFPAEDTENGESIEWLKKKTLKHGLDAGLLVRRHISTEDRRADRYEYWQERLLILYEEFDEPHETSIRQFWYDNRNKPQWYTFWVAMLILVLTVFFGFVQSIEGALQVYKAYHPQ